MLSSLFIDSARADSSLRRNGFALLDSAAFMDLIGGSAEELQQWRVFWDDLPPDAHLRDGGGYRRRRHASFILDDQRLAPVAHRPHWQPLIYNALHGGLERWFEPLDSALSGQALWKSLLIKLGERASALRGARTWYIESHLFRIDTTGGIGRPTPEGAHRDGVDMVAVILAGRHNIKGGESRVFEAQGPHGLRFTLSEPWSLLLLDDARVIHETTPIQPLDDDIGYRDTLVLTYRSGGFLEPDRAD